MSNANETEDTKTIPMEIDEPTQPTQETQEAQLPYDDGTTVELVSLENQSFTVSKAVIGRISKTIYDLMADSPHSTSIPLPTVESLILGYIVQYAKIHAKDITPPAVLTMEITRDGKERVPDKPVEQSEPDKEFIKALSQEDIFKIILAANYLDIRPLLDLGCQAIAQSVLGKTPKEIYTMFGVEKELTPEEEEEVRKENPWLEDR
jgi:S-phase kinase-associated protein 1